jgi:hypothetical protein
MINTPEHLADRLQTEGQKSLEFFRGLAPEQWDQTIYTEGSQWTVRQVLAHFVSTESSINRLIQNILEGGPGVSEGFDIDAYNERKVAALHEVPISELMDQFNQYRQRNVRVVVQMHPEDLIKTGRHPFLGIAPLVDIIKLLYRHNQIHQRDVRKVVK